MEITRTIIVLDAADLDAVSGFWARLLGGTVDPEDDWHTVRVGGEARLGIQLAPDHVPPRWPTEPGQPQQQIHLDLFVTDPPAAHEHALAAGARLLQPADLSAPGRFRGVRGPRRAPVLPLLGLTAGPGGAAHGALRGRAPENGRGQGRGIRCSLGR